MVPVSMRDQKSQLHRARSEFFVQSETEQANPGARIENDDLAVGAHFHTTGVSAITDCALSRDRNRTANAPQPYSRRYRLTVRYRFWFGTARDFRQEPVDRAGEQFPRDRFEQIFICAGFKGAGSIDPIIAAGDDDDLGWLQLLANRAAHLKAVRFWH